MNPLLHIAGVPRLATLLLLLATLLLAAGCASLPKDVVRTPSQAIAGSTATPLGKIAADSSPASELTGFRLMPTGAFALSTRISLTQRAVKSLDVQYYEIENDDTGRYFLRALRDAALRGVRVRLLVDDLYTVGTDALLSGLAATPNVEIRLFNPFPAGRDRTSTRFLFSLADIRRVDHRMHNKLFIADGVMAVSGGRNIGNEYFMRDMSSNFVDIDAFITGALVPQLENLFDGYWNSDVVFPLRSIIPAETDAAALQSRFDAATGPATTAPPEQPPANDPLGYGPIAGELDDGQVGLVWAEAEAYADSPDKIHEMALMYGLAPLEDVDSVRYNVLEQMRRAQKEIVLTSPYLIPGQTGMEMMREVRARGVTVRVLTNSLAATDEPLVHIGYKHYRPLMLKLGVELYELSPTRVVRNMRLGFLGDAHGKLHAKTAVIDRQTVFIGSMNFDPRSEKKNTEMAIIVKSPTLSREVLRLMDLDKLQASYRVALDPDHPGQLEWLATNEEGEVVLHEEPDTTVWERGFLDLLAPFAPEELL